ncbi:MAG: FecR domain-containing protein, partial [Fidelibacterota bacterium]
MKPKLILMTLIVVVATVAISVSPPAPFNVRNSPGPAREFGKITLPLGMVQVRPAEAQEWQKARVKHPVFVKDGVQTKAKSRAEITLTGGGKVRIGENAELILTEASVAPLKKDFSANLKKGQIWVSAKAAFGEKKNVAIRTPTAVAAIRGTKYRAVAGEEESSILVYEGEVDVNWAENVQDTQRGQVPDKGGGP